MVGSAASLSPCYTVPVARSPRTGADRCPLQATSLRLICLFLAREEREEEKRMECDLEVIGISKQRGFELLTISSAF